MDWLLVLLGLAVKTYALSHKSVYPPITTEKVDGLKDVGEPLIITPFLENGRIQEARDLAEVKGLNTSVVSYSGYFTTNKTYNSNMFFWFFPAQFNKEKAPVLLWLQGGPGGSSLFGLFVENGPFVIDANLHLGTRSTSWSVTHSVLYIDNPVGTGYSFTEADEGYARSEQDVADNLYSALTQFFTLFPEYQKRDFYATGESYAGKYVPAISHRIHLENQESPNVTINLKGMAIGDGFSDPVNMLNYGELLYNVGLIDYHQKRHFDGIERQAKRYIKAGQYNDAFELIDELLDGDLTGHPSYFKNCTGFDFYFNFLMSSEPKAMGYYGPFVQQPAVRKAIHVGNKTYNDGAKVEKFMAVDMYKSVAPLIVDLLDAQEGYKVLFYNGQLDIIVAGILTENFLYKLRWHGQKGWENAPRKIWKVGNDIAGYSKVDGNLTYLMVRNAGHIVPYDQPKNSFDMINRFTSGKPFA